MDQTQLSLPSAPPAGQRVFTPDWKRASVNERAALVLHKEAPMVPSVAAQQPRTLRDCISSNQVDRYGDVIDQGGLNFSNYHNVVLWGHDSGGGFFGGVPMPPIAKSLGIETTTEGDRTFTYSLTQFAGDPQQDGYEFADTVYKLAKGGFVPDRSIGVRPTAFKSLDDDSGYFFAASDVLEYSVVPIGANTDAQQTKSYAAKHGFSLQPLDDWARKTLDTVHGAKGIWLEREWLEAFIKAAGFNRGLKILDLSKSDLAVVVKARFAPRPVTKGALAYHKSPTSSATSWDAGEEVKKATTDDLEKMCCAVVGDPDVKSSYKLPHHECSKDYPVNKAGLKAARGRLDSTEGIDKSAAEEHLKKHYSDAGMDWNEADGDKDSTAENTTPADPEPLESSVDVLDPLISMFAAAPAPQTDLATALHEIPADVLKGLLKEAIAGAPQ